MTDLSGGGGANAFLNVGEDEVENEGSLTLSGKNSLFILSASGDFLSFQIKARIVFVVSSLRLWPGCRR